MYKQGYTSALVDVQDDKCWKQSEIRGKDVDLPGGRVIWKRKIHC